MVIAFYILLSYDIKPLASFPGSPACKLQAMESWAGPGNEASRPLQECEALFCKGLIPTQRSSLGGQVRQPQVTFHLVA